MTVPMLKPILSRFSDTELLMPESKVLEFQALVSGMASHEFAKVFTEGDSEIKASSDEDFWGDNAAPDSYEARLKKALRPYVVKNGTLQIPVRGILLNNFPYQFFSYATGYAYIWEAFKRGMGDMDVKRVAFIIHSPGGEVAGNFDLVDRMFGMRGTKPVAAFAHEYAYSAAYSIFSVADPGRGYVSRSGGVGSIGVITSHIDISKMMDDIGYKVTFIHFGKHKKDGNPYEALPEDVRERIQSRINAIGEEFVSIVARNRGMDPNAVRATEALTYPAQEALEIGLADSIGPLDEALKVFEADINQQPEDETMSKTYTQEEYDAAVANARAEGEKAGVATGKAEGAKAALDRMNTVFGSQEGQDRPKMAVKLLGKENLASMDAQGIIDLLADYPKETAEAGGDKDGDGDEGEGEDKTQASGQDFNAAMSRHKNNVGADDVDADKSKTGNEDVEFAVAFGIPGLRSK